MHYDYPLYKNERKLNYVNKIPLNRRQSKVWCWRWL